MKTSELLIKAKAVIEVPKNWAQGNYAYNKRKEPVGFKSDQATCFCALGAVYRNSDDYDAIASSARNLLSDAAQEYGYSSIALLNDHTDHKTVMSAFDSAIEQAKLNEGQS